MRIETVKAKKIKDRRAALIFLSCTLSGDAVRNPLESGGKMAHTAAHQGGLAELVDALDSKSSSNECGFESHSRYFAPHWFSMFV